MSTDDIWESTEWYLQAYGLPITSVTPFKYLVRIITALDDNWPTVASNIKKAQKNWDQLNFILVWEGANTRESGTFFKAAVQEIIIFGSETWVMNLYMGRTLGGFSIGRIKVSREGNHSSF